MVVAAYLAGLLTTPAAYIGVVLGLRWWARLRRSEAHTAPERPVYPITPPPPAPTQEDIVVSRVNMRSRPINRVHRRR